MHTEEIGEGGTGLGLTSLLQAWCLGVAVSDRGPRIGQFLAGWRLISVIQAQECDW